MKNSIDREIWRLLWPVLLLTLAQKLGSAFEGILVSVNSSQELAVMGICGPYITIITTVSYGLGIAANAATGRAYADRSWEASHKACVRIPSADAYIRAYNVSACRSAALPCLCRAFQYA